MIENKEWKRLETRRCQGQPPKRSCGKGEEIHENLNKIHFSSVSHSFPQLLRPQSWDPHNRCTGGDAEGWQSNWRTCSTGYVERKMGPKSNGRRNLATNGYLSTLSAPQTVQLQMFGWRTKRKQKEAAPASLQIPSSNLRCYQGG